MGCMACGDVSTVLHATHDVMQPLLRAQLVEAHARAADAHGLAVRSRSRGADDGAAASSGTLRAALCCLRQAALYLADKATDLSQAPHGRVLLSLGAAHPISMNAWFLPATLGCGRQPLVQTLVLDVGVAGEEEHQQPTAQLREMWQRLSAERQAAAAPAQVPTCASAARCSAKRRSQASSNRLQATLKVLATCGVAALI